MRSVVHAAARAASVCVILPLALQAQTHRGQPVNPAHRGPAVIESLSAALARDAARDTTVQVNPKARNGRHGEWVVPSPQGTFFNCSGDHNVVNKWGDTRMGIGFRRSVHVHGAFFAGQAAEGVWAGGLRVHGFRGGERVASTAWFPALDAQARWFDIDLYAVDRIEIEALPAFGHSGWYGMDDLTFTPLDGAGEAAVVVLTFDDCHYGQRLTASNHGGLDWELGSGPVDLDEGMPAPRILPQPADEDPPQDGGPGPDLGGQGGTPPELLIDFQGVVRGDAGSFTFPPDSCGAVGPAHFVEAINRNFAIYDKATGEELANMLLSSFLPGSNGDPRVLFDQYSGRWIVLATDFNGDERIFLAVSLSDDPTGEWFKVSFVTDVNGDAGCWPDYPTLGVDASGIYTSAYMVGCGMTIWAIDKAPLIAPEPTIGSITAFRNLPVEGAVQPAHTYGASSGEFFVSRQSSTGLRIRSVEPPLDSPSLKEVGTVAVPVHFNPPNVPALGSITALNTVDARPMNAVYREGSLWTAHTIDVNGRAACRWYQISVQEPSLVQSGTIQDPSLEYFFPSLAVNDRGDVVIGFSGANANQYAGAYFSGRSAQDPPGEMAPPALYKAGQAPQNNVDQFGRNRWGDYSLTSLDPADGHTIWTIQEYAHDDNTWGTWIGALAPVALCDGVAGCSDFDGDGIRDDNCVWVSCVAGSCEGTDIPFADMGAVNGLCTPDGTADSNDRFHALNCFSNSDTLGQPGYPCENDPPQAYNVDAGGALGSCAPDGVCDANDAFHALNAFEGTTTCQCPMSGPAPQIATDGKAGQAAARLRLVVEHRQVRAGGLLAVDVMLDSALDDLRGYQLHLGVTAGISGQLELLDVSIPEPGVFDSNAENRRPQPLAWSAFNTTTAQMLAGIDGPGQAAPAGSKLATFVYRATPDAAGEFVVQILHDRGDPAQRTFLFPTPASGRIDITSRDALVRVTPSLRR